MELRTKVEIETPYRKISHAEKILFTGSCFADEIGNKMADFLYDAMVNPFGVLFNPASIYAAIIKIMDGGDYSDDIIVENKDVFFSRYHSGKFASLDKKELIKMVNESLYKAREHFLCSSHIVISLGTSWVYRHKQLGTIVANCHKERADNFAREFLSPEETFNLMSEVVRLNPNKHWIFTISPIRHFKDGAHGNQVSKSALHIAVGNLLETFKNVSYFPAYEIMNDELRDYRFYATDMLHPSEIAVEFIWDKFQENYIMPEESEINKKIGKYIAMTKHRPLFPDGEEFKSFVETRNKLGKEIYRELALLGVKTP